MAKNSRADPFDCELPDAMNGGSSSPGTAAFWLRRIETEECAILQPEPTMRLTIT
jgi:hypothetical protein